MPVEAPHVYVVEDRELGDEGIVLVDEDRPGLLQVVELAQKRRLAGPAGADQDDLFVLPDREADVAEDRDLTVGDGNVV